MRARGLLFPCLFLAAVTVRGADLVDQVVSRGLDLTGPSFKSCGDMSSPSAQDCFLYAYEHKLPAIGTFSISGRAPEASVLTPEGAFVSVSAYSDRQGLTEYRCLQPFVAFEYGSKRVRCKEKYRAPVGASILTAPPVWLTKKEEHPRLLERPDVPASACPSVEGKVIAELLVDSAGRVPDVRIVLLPPGCSAKKIVNFLKRWRYSKPERDGKPIAIVEVVEITFSKAK